MIENLSILDFQAGTQLLAGNFRISSALSDNSKIMQIFHQLPVFLDIQNNPDFPTARVDNKLSFCGCFHTAIIAQDDPIFQRLYCTPLSLADKTE